MYLNKIKKIFYKNKYLFKLLKVYWIFIYLIKIIINPKNFFLLTKSQNQNEENNFLKNLSKHTENKNFIELGFHFRQFNTVGLIENNYSGKLIDSAKYDFLNIILMRLITKLIKKDVKVVNKFINLENINEVFDNEKLGFLSIDIDGNDYWILSKILENNIIPEVLIVEYNVSFLDHPITIPYKKDFNMFKEHSSHCYHGASLVAFDKLTKKYDYALIKSIAGTNAIFIQKKLLNKTSQKQYEPHEVFQECLSRNRKGKNNSKIQYDQIKHLPLVKV